MPKIHPIQNDFTAGILSRRLFSRSNTEGYRSGLAECRNFITLKQGPVESRGGFLYNQTVSGDLARIFGFQLDPDSSIGEAFAILVDGTNVSPIGVSGTTSGAEVLSNTDFATGLSPWTTNTTGSATVTWSTGRARLNPGLTSTGGSQIAEIRQSVTIDAGDTGKVHRLTISLAPTTIDSPPIRLRVGTTSGADDITLNPDSTFTPGVTNFHVTVRAESVELEDEPGVNFPQQGFRLVESVSVTVQDITDTIEFPHGFSDDEIRNLRAFTNPDDDILYLLSGTSIPKQLSYNSGTNTWAFADVAFAMPPSEWTGTTWPSVVAFFQGRAWWSGVEGQSNRIWGSKSNLYTNIDVGTGVADDAIDFRITRRGKVHWLEGINTLLVGTNNAEYIIESQGGVITPEDRAAPPQSANGGAAVQTIQAGNFVIYLSNDRRKVRSIIFRWQEQTWRSRDLTFSAEDLTFQNEIVAMTYSKDPENTLWFVTSNGEMLGCTYDPESETVGWHRHSTKGEIVDIANVDRQGVSYLNIITRRTIEGTNRLFVETLDTRVNTDSSIIITNNSPSTAILVPHLAGESVQVVVDGAVHPNVMLDTMGAGVLQWEGTVVEVGLQFIATMQTLPTDYGYVSGSGMSLLKGWNKIVLRLINTAFPKINGVRPPTRTPSTPMNEREPYRTQDIDVTDLGYDEFAQITVEQDLPLRTQVVGLFGELNQSSL